MPAPVSSASARLAARLVPAVPSTMSSRSSAAPSGVRRRTAPSTSTVEMNVSISAGSCWPATYGIAMQVAVSSSARSGSPEAIPSHRLDITRSTIASASARPEQARPAASLLAAGLLAGAPWRALFFLLTASSYGPQAAELGVQGVDEVPERDVYRLRQPEPARDQKLTARLTPTWRSGVPGAASTSARKARASPASVSAPLFALTLAGLARAFRALVLAAPGTPERQVGVSRAVSF